MSSEGKETSSMISVLAPEAAMPFSGKCTFIKAKPVISTTINELYEKNRFMLFHLQNRRKNLSFLPHLQILGRKKFTHPILLKKPEASLRKTIFGSFHV